MAGFSRRLRGVTGTVVATVWLAAAALVMIHRSSAEESHFAQLCEERRIDASAPRELRAYDFLLGDWLLERQDRPEGFNWTEGSPAFVKGRYALGGHALLVEWYHLEPGMDDPRDAEVRELWMLTFHDDAWRLTLEAPGRQTPQVYRSAARGGLVFEPVPSSADVKDRLVFSDVEGDSWKMATAPVAADAPPETGYRVRFAASRVRCDHLDLSAAD